MDFARIPPLLRRNRFAGGLCGVKTVHFVANSSYININRTEADTSSTSDTLNAVIVFVHIVFQFMHEPLANPLVFYIPGVVPRGMVGEQGKHAGIPVSHPDAGFAEGLILDIKAPAGGANIGTGAAVDAGEGFFFPEGCVIEFQYGFFPGAFRFRTAAVMVASAVFFQFIDF